MSDNAEKKEPRVIKRYANRKLYDMSESCYITHEEIAALVRSGEELRIVDNKTKADLTSATLTQILLDEERRVKRTLPIDTLKQFFAKKVRQPVVNLRDEAEKRVREVLQGMRRDPGQPAAQGSTPPPPPEPSPVVLEAGGKPTEALRHAVEERWAEIQSYFSQFDFPKRIAELEKRIAQLESELAEARGLDRPPANDDGADEPS